MKNKEKSEARPIDHERLKGRFEELGISGAQTWLANAIGMRQSSVRSILKGETERPKQLFEIALQLYTSEEYLLALTEDPSPPPANLDTAAGRRLETIRQAYGLKPIDFGLNEWDWYLNIDNILGPRQKLMQDIALATNLPIAFVERGHTNDLTAAQTAKLLSSALRWSQPSRKDPPAIFQTTR